MRQERENESRDHHLPLVASIDLGGTQVRLALVRGTEIFARIAMPTGKNATPQDLLPRMDSALQALLQEAGCVWNEIGGIGISAPGPLDNRRGIICSPPNLPAWVDLPLRDLLQQKYQKPVYLENDANAAALGEYYFGAGQGQRNLVYLTVSTGIGAGVINDGKILEGMKGMAGELGHTTIDWQGKRCACGNTGCLETLASGQAIARQASQAVAEGRGQELLAFVKRASEQAHNLHAPGQDHEVEGEKSCEITAQSVAQAAEAGIPLAREIILQAATALGVGLINALHIFNPEMIILGGGVTQMGAIFMEPALQVVQERAMKADLEGVRIVPAQLGANSGLIGAGALLSYYQTQAGA